MEVEGAAAQSRTRRWLIGAGGLAGVIVLAVLAFAILEPIQVLPRMRLGPGYSLVDQHGDALSSEDMRGAVVLYSFGYSECGDACLATYQTVREVQSRLDEVDMGDTGVRFVTLTFDPETDTPPVLAETAQTVGADGEQWALATGDPGHVENVIRSGFKAWYRDNPDGTISFDPRLVLVDGWGVIRGEYRYQTISSDADKIVRHLGILAEEIRNSDGAATIAYEAAHLFLCYP